MFHYKNNIYKMKIKSLLYLSVAALLATSCSEDNKPTVADIQGVYAGYSVASCQYFTNNCVADESINITENADGTAKVTYTSSSFGEFTVPNATLSENAGVYTLSGEGHTLMGMTGNVSSYDCTFTAVIKSKTDASAKFTVPAVMGGLNIEFKTGDAPADLLISGSYKGYSEAASAYFKGMYEDNASVAVSSNGDGTLTVAFESEQWGKFNVAAASVEKTESGYSLSGSGKVLMGMGESKSEYDFNLSATIDAAKENFEITFTMPAVMGGMTVTIRPGTAPAQ